MDQIGWFQFEPDAPERFSHSHQLHITFFHLLWKGVPGTCFESFIPKAPRGKGWVRINESVRVRLLLVAHSIAAVDSTDFRSARSACVRDGSRRPCWTARGGRHGGRHRCRAAKSTATGPRRQEKVSRFYSFWSANFCCLVLSLWSGLSCAYSGEVWERQMQFSDWGQVRVALAVDQSAAGRLIAQLILVPLNVRVVDSWVANGSFHAVKCMSK